MACIVIAHVTHHSDEALCPRHRRIEQFLVAQESKVAHVSVALGGRSCGSRATMDQIVFLDHVYCANGANKDGAKLLA